MLLVRLNEESMEATMSDVDPTLVTEFNEAAALGRKGDHEQSLAAYQEVMSRAELFGVPATKHFIALTRMRIGYCLMDLGRHKEALDYFSSIEQEARQLQPADAFEFRFALGNTYGRLGRLPEMYNELINAIAIAQDLGDYKGRPVQCWANILMHAERNKGWHFLSEKSNVALQHAEVAGLTKLELFAGEMQRRAKRQLQNLN